MADASAGGPAAVETIRGEALAMMCRGYSPSEVRLRTGAILGLMFGRDPGLDLEAALGAAMAAIEEAESTFGRAVGDASARLVLAYVDGALGDVGPAGRN